MHRTQKSSKIFNYRILIFALALTGCATGRYHTVASSGPVVQTADFPIMRPLEGDVVIPFGARQSGVFSKGAWIKGRPGASVLAAAEGWAVLVDERMEGYGKTVILEHAGGFWTVYAHLAEILVKPGEVIRRGRPLGRLDTQNERLYFELRRGDRAEDPARSWI